MTEFDNNGWNQEDNSSSDNSRFSNLREGLKNTYNAVAKITKPLWWPIKKSVQFGIWGIKQESTFKKILSPVFAAAAIGTYLSAAVYGATLAYVKSNDVTSFLNWPATKGQWKGKLTRFSEKGTWPCNSFEGNLRTGEAADSEPFAVRKWDSKLIEALRKVPENTDITLVYHDNRLPQESFGKVSSRTDGKEENEVEATFPVGCIQRRDHTAYGLHYTDAKGNKISIGREP